jgi:SAM-dependent methyltransferase
VSSRLLRAWLAWARLRARLERRPPLAHERERLVARLAPGRTFVDVGGMWGVHGAIALAAAAASASRVTLVDVMPATEELAAERRRAEVEFVHGDIHDDAVLERVGRHHVVWCTGVIYHVPDPLRLLASLRRLTADVLVLGSETLPELPGLRQACVFYPYVDAGQRLAHASARPGRQLGLSEPFRADAGYGNWFWGISPSALEAMVKAAGFELLDCSRRALYTTIVARAPGANASADDG